ncbi:hypothetical protein B0H12DRAFT_1289382 [Mycena haematopus]|nr:hypothetical protein B0H12DRAFT_1289382 [Mycena haematopus]
MAIKLWLFWHVEKTKLPSAVALKCDETQLDIDNRVFVELLSDMLTDTDSVSATKFEPTLRCTRIRGLHLAATSYLVRFIGGVDNLFWASVLMKSRSSSRTLASTYAGANQWRAMEGTETYELKERQASGRVRRHETKSPTLGISKIVQRRAGQRATHQVRAVQTRENSRHHTQLEENRLAQVLIELNIGDNGAWFEGKDERNGRAAKDVASAATRARRRYWTVPHLHAAKVGLAVGVTGEGHGAGCLDFWTSTNRRRTWSITSNVQQEASGTLKHFLDASVCGIRETGRLRALGVAKLREY